MKIRSAFLTVFSEYIYPDDGKITMSELIALLRTLNYTDEAIKSAIFRLRQQRMIFSFKAGDKTYYSFTEEGIEKLKEGYTPIPQQKEDTIWSGQWQLLIYSLPEKERPLRDQFRKEISCLGFGQLTPGSWISPYDCYDQVQKLVKKYKIEDYVQIFNSTHLGTKNKEFLVSQVWDLQDLNVKYHSFIQKFTSNCIPHTEITEATSFAQRVLLINEYRPLVQLDPFLPCDLLPKSWLGKQASAIFHNHYELLAGKSFQYYRNVRLQLDSVMRALPTISETANMRY
ncbi:PaaX family transcriptional regulator C-terminal domain-containing protein [Ammoniphilus sp. CFH 90114]|uniref:PaaX family transcriptional regulator n=1 Tax=Ammoniphilus sp. CFH 90114 TaxID=2493665 RepID=UPI0013E922F0|nr:PaaX family transcriptional regulator C-terminal domain-containing protein [Ammoniphilus sp. CFH 90114]